MIFIIKSSGSKTKKFKLNSCSQNLILNVSYLETLRHKKNLLKNLPGLILGLLLKLDPAYLIQVQFWRLQPLDLCSLYWICAVRFHSRLQDDQHHIYQPLKKHRSKNDFQKGSESWTCVVEEKTRLCALSQKLLSVWTTRKILLHSARHSQPKKITFGLWSVLKKAENRENNLEAIKNIPPTIPLKYGRRMGKNKATSEFDLVPNIFKRKSTIYYKYKALKNLDLLINPCSPYATLKRYFEPPKLDMFTMRPSRLGTIKRDA